MAFVSITLEVCASDWDLKQAFAFMLDMANKYQMPVKATINEIEMVVEPFKGKGGRTLS